MQNKINELADYLTNYTSVVQKLVKALQTSATVWNDKKYSELAFEITKMTSKVSKSVSCGDDLIHLFEEYQRCAVEEFD